MNVTRIRITNYRGIEALDAEIPPAGAIAKGRNGSGKTTLLRALRAAFGANDIGPDAIRIGHDKAEILVDMGNATVRRAVTQKGAPLAVVADVGGTKAAMQAPQSYLTDLLGPSAALDPLDLFLCKPKDRRAKILAALPVTVTREMLELYAELPPGFDVAGHGLEVVDRLHAHYYEERAAANKAAKAARADADRAAKDAPVAPAEAIPLSDAVASLRAASARWNELLRQKEEAAKAAERTEKTRRRIADLRASAEADEARAAEGPNADDARAAANDVHAAEESLRLAQAALAAAQERLDIVHRRALAGSEFARQAKAARTQADDLEAAVVQATVEAPSESDLSDAAAAAEAATEAEAIARQAEEARAKADHAQKLAALADEQEASAKKLDGIVKSLANDAPAHLLEKQSGIPGLALRGDDVLLDGVSLDGLCGNEALRFAIEIAKRANAKSKILIVDKLEAIDPEQFDEFVRECTRDGWQLIGSRVTGGEFVLEAIELGEETARTSRMVGAERASGGVH